MRDDHPIPAQIVAPSTITDSSLLQFSLPRKALVVLNRFQTGVEKFNHSMFFQSQLLSPSYELGGQDKTNHLIILNFPSYG